MIKINIKDEVKELEASGERYETKIVPFYIDNTLTHKHISIPALDKTYVRDNDLIWYLLEDNCDYCN